MTNQYQKAYFLLSVADVKQLPPDEGIEIAIVGRSNAGKSSVLNCITKNKKLARVSKTPGRTQMINLFQIDEGRRIADLPGYGYAKVALQAKQKWQKTISAYFDERKSLKGLIVVMDIRHPLKPTDIQLLAFSQTRNLSIHILLNKVDKLSRNEAQQTVRVVKAALTAYGNSVTFQIFSALKGIGVKELNDCLNDWFNYQ